MEMMNTPVLIKNVQINANQDFIRTGIKVIEDILSFLLSGNSAYLPYTPHGVSEVDEKMYMVVVIPGTIENYEPRIIDYDSSSYLEIMQIGMNPTHIDIKTISTLVGSTSSLILIIASISFLSGIPQFISIFGSLLLLGMNMKAIVGD